MKIACVGAGPAGLLLSPIFAGATLVLFVAILAPVWFMMNNRPNMTANSNTSSAPNLSPIGTGNVNSNSNRNLGPAPDVQFTRLSGEVLRLKDYRGQVVLLNFWATWNAPSKTEVAVLNVLHESFNSKGLVVIGISYDDTAEQVREFQKENLQKYQIGLGGNAVEGLTAQPLPTTYIIDRRGKIRTKLVGVQNRQTLEAEILPLLSEAR
jgi:peroxiredoxin